MKRSESAVMHTPHLPLGEHQAPNAQPFPYRDYVQAQSRLASAIKRAPFYALVLGASGTGKTSLARELSTASDRPYRLMHLSAAKVSLASLVRVVAMQLRVTTKRTALETTHALADVLRAQPTALVVWIDEANGLHEDTLTELRSVAEFSCELPQLFSVVLSGTPDLAAVIDSPSLFALKRRCSVRCTLRGLQRDELDAFLSHRFGAQDAERVLPSVKDELFERTSAAPALIDRIVRHALERADNGNITESMLREALDVWTL